MLPVQRAELERENLKDIQVTKVEKHIIFMQRAKLESHICTSNKS